jgi:hypothetical protein
MVYMTADGLMGKVTKHCQKYGLSYSKLAQMAIAEKLEREEQQTKGVRGSQATNHRDPADTPIPFSTEVPEDNIPISKEVSGR